jgi:hypothetical protein
MTDNTIYSLLAGRYIPHHRPYREIAAEAATAPPRVMQQTRAPAAVPAPRIESDRGVVAAEPENSAPIVLDVHRGLDGKISRLVTKDEPLMSGGPEPPAYVMDVLRGADDRIRRIVMRPEKPKETEA